MRTHSSDEPTPQDKPEQSLQETAVEHPEGETTQLDRQRRIMFLARIYETILSWDEEEDTTNKPNEDGRLASPNTSSDETQDRETEEQLLTTE